LRKLVRVIKLVGMPHLGGKPYHRHRSNAS
jgi:hypothetical protein